MFYDAHQRAINEQRAALIEDVLSGSADTKEGLKAAMTRIKQLRKR